MIPNAGRAVVDIRKLEVYVLSTTHERGQHKARMFAEVFGLTINDANALRDILLDVVNTREAQLGERIFHGQLYRVDFQLTWNRVTENVRSTWIIRREEEFPRLVSCFVQRKRR